MAFEDNKVGIFEVENNSEINFNNDNKKYLKRVYGNKLKLVAIANLNDNTINTTNYNDIGKSKYYIDHYFTEETHERVEVGDFLPIGHCIYYKTLYCVKSETAMLQSLYGKSNEYFSISNKLSTKHGPNNYTLQIGRWGTIESIELINGEESQKNTYHENNSVYCTEIKKKIIL